MSNKNNNMKHKKMKVVVFGATGTTGRVVVERALELGYAVTAFVRNPAKVESKHANLTVVQGDAMDPASVEQAVQGHDAVLCSLGAGLKGEVRSEGTRNIIRAMEKAKIRRFICQSTLGVGDSRGNMNAYWKYIMFGLLLRRAYADHVKQEELIKQSPLDWTIVRPAALTDGELTGNYRHGFSAKAKNLTLDISRADVADFMLKQLNDDTYLCATPGLSYQEHQDRRGCEFSTLSPLYHNYGELVDFSLGLNDLLWPFFHPDRSLFATSLPKHEFDAQWVLQVVAYRQQRNHAAYLSHRKHRLALLTQLE